MSTYTATIRWTRSGEGEFAKGQYSRVHEWAFDGGAVVKAGPSPHVVPAPWSDETAVDPDELGSVRADFEARGVNVQDGWWGYKLMVIVDPDGNQLFFPYPAEDQE
jgi:hypothetical protein